MTACVFREHNQEKKQKRRKSRNRIKFRAQVVIGLRFEMIGKEGVTQHQPSPATPSMKIQTKPLLWVPEGYRVGGDQWRMPQKQG